MGILPFQHNIFSVNLNFLIQNIYFKNFFSHLKYYFGCNKILIVSIFVNFWRCMLNSNLFSALFCYTYGQRFVLPPFMAYKLNIELIFFMLRISNVVFLERNIHKYCYVDMCVCAQSPPTPAAAAATNERVQTQLR